MGGGVTINPDPSIPDEGEPSNPQSPEWTTAVKALTDLWKRRKPIYLGSTYWTLGAENPEPELEIIKKHMGDDYANPLKTYNEGLGQKYIARTDLSVDADKSNPYIRYYHNPYITNIGYPNGIPQIDLGRLMAPSYNYYYTEYNRLWSSKFDGVFLFRYLFSRKVLIDTSAGGHYNNILTADFKSFTNEENNPPSIDEFLDEYNDYRKMITAIIQKRR